MLNPIWLKTFTTLIDTGHFTKTAQKLFMTQPGVSQHIKKLEEYCGYPLIIREKKSFELTEQGRLVYQYSQQLSQILLPIAMGLGFTVLPKSAVDQFTSKDKLTVIQTPQTVSETLYLVKKKHRVLGTRYRTIEKVITELFNQAKTTRLHSKRLCSRGNH
ncbi:TPA: LysR family transcriptional regulator [Photobacterium damselae]